MEIFSESGIIENRQILENVMIVLYVKLRVGGFNVWSKQKGSGFKM